MPISIGEQQKPAEDTPLLHDDRNSSPASTSHSHEDDMKNALSNNVVNRLYLSHFLSTWNSRVFEFGAVLYLATIYPGTLSPLSVYALSRGLAAIIFAPAVGHYIDVTNRLKVVRLSISKYISLLSKFLGLSHTNFVIQFYNDLLWLHLVPFSTFS